MPGPADLTRSPPHSLEAERAALGSVLIRSSALDDLHDLQVDDFFLPAHREILEAMRAVALRNRTVDVLALADELKAQGMLTRLEGGAVYLNELANATPTAENVRQYAGIVAAKATLRRIIATCADAMSTAYADGDPEELLNRLRISVGDIELPTSKGPVRVGDVVGKTIDGIQKRGEEPEKYLVPTGLARVDRKIGGLRANHLIVVAANPGKGKTSFVWNVAINAALAGVPVLVFSLEMEQDELIERGLSYLGRINGRAVSLGRMSVEEWHRVHRAGATLDRDRETDQEVPLYVDDRKLTASQVCAEARRWRAKHPSPRAMIVIDYLGLVESDTDERTREREVAKMSRQFKLLAHRTQANAPVVLCAQLNRDNVSTKDGKPRPPVLRDLKDSGAIEADADMVIFPWWEGRPPATGTHPAELRIGKYRGGAVSEIDVIWEPEYMTFADVPEDDDQQQMDLPTGVPDPGQPF